MSDANLFGAAMPTSDLPVPKRERWEILRAGIQNVWEYDDQRFVFHRGRLLLRGRNEVGKSKALEVLLPFLLDANLSPQRLDPFGSSSRQMRWNLVGDRSPDREIGLGYVWLELGRKTESGGHDTMTLGAGLKARRSDTKVDSWFFITSMRVDRDLQLLDDGRRPLEKRRLQEALGRQGTLFERKQAYRDEVDRRLFGLGRDQYDALIETLIQLRRPQLSRQLDPAGLSRILTASLPPLDRDVIGRLAEGFSRLDKHRNERDGWRRTLDAVGGFRRVYRRYGTLHVVARATAMTRAESEHQRARAALRDREQALEAAKSAVGALEAELSAKESEQRRLEIHLETLRSSEAYRVVEELERAAREADERRLEADRAQLDLERDEKDEGAAVSAREEALRRLEDQAEEERDRAGLAVAAAREAALASEHQTLAALIGEGDTDAARGALDALLIDRRAKIQKVEAIQSEVLAARSEVERVEARLRDAETAARAARERLTCAVLEREEAEQALSDAVGDWLDTLEALVLSEEEAGRVREAPLDDMSEVVEELHSQQRREIEDRVGDFIAVTQKLNEQIETVTCEREELLGTGHRPPEPPPWRGDRTGRPGAPLYLLCEPSGLLDGAGYAGVEAALEASGLLDAWVMPDGSMPAEEVLDAVLVDARTRAVEPASDGSGQRSLADVIEPVSAGGVPAQVVRAILGSIALVCGEGEPDGRELWVATDGRFRLGPLNGAWRKEGIEHLGATAREEARARRLEALERLIEELSVTRARREKELRTLRDRREAMSVELRRFPSLKGLTSARAKVEAAGSELDARLAEEASTKDLVAQKRAELRARSDRRDAVAGEAGLSAWVDALPDLRELTMNYRAASSELLAAARVRVEAGRQLEEREVTLRELKIRLERSIVRRRKAEETALDAAEKARTLREARDASGDRILEEISETERSRHALVEDLRGGRARKSRLDKDLGTAESDLERAAGSIHGADAARDEAGHRFRRLASAGLIEEVELGEPTDKPPEAWTLTDTLLVARAATAAATGISDASQEALDRAENRVTEQHAQLGRQLASGVRLSPTKEDGILLYQAALNGRQSNLRDLAQTLSEEVASRDRLLDVEERELFESFLSGETREHLQSRLRAAQALVDRINGELRERPMPGGMLLRLSWKPDERAPEGTTKAIDLLLRSAALLSTADRDVLAVFLRRRLEEARSTDAELPGAGLSERMIEVLDYRSWFSFVVEHKSAPAGWRPLTKKVHGAGSGGQKAVMLHLPLFAAAAAFYASAREGSPRIILLDEAFAGIDRKMRGSLMGLIVAFDLDFIMTSYEEWGFYAEIDGLSTYNLVRDPAMPGVLCERFVWDGRVDREVAA